MLVTRKASTRSVPVPKIHSRREVIVCGVLPNHRIERAGETLSDQDQLDATQAVGPRGVADVRFVGQSSLRLSCPRSD